MRLIFLLVFLFQFTTGYANHSKFWGKTGHRATAQIAEQYLSRKAKKQIDALLDGKSLAMVSNYADEIKSDPEFRKYSPWHYVNFPFDSNYEDHPKNPAGDIYQAISLCIDILKDEESKKKEKAFYLKMLIHLMGDLHQPLHIGLASDKGGNDFQVRWFDSGTNLHSVWDDKMIDHFKMSYTELAREADELSKEQLRAIQAGTLKDWMYESRKLAIDVYNNTQVGQNLRYGYSYRYMHTVRSQIQKGGIRLAVLLNDIFA